MYHNFFIHAFVDGHLSCFHVLTIVNSAAMNIGMHVSFSILVSSVYMPRSVIARSYGGFISTFFKESPYFLVAVPICIPTNSARGFPFLHTLSSIYCFRLFDDGHSDWCELISHCSFDLHFSNNEWCWASFHVFGSHKYVFFGKMSV